MRVQRPDGTVADGYSADLPGREVLGVDNIGSRVFYKPGPTIRSAKTGEPITPEQLARNLLTKAELEHAVLPGKKAAVVFCVVCQGPIQVIPGHHPRQTCSNKCKCALRRGRQERPCSTPGCANVNRGGKTGKCHACATVPHSFTPEERARGSAAGSKALRGKTAEERSQMAQKAARTRVLAMSDEERKSRGKLMAEARWGQGGGE